MAKFYHTRAKRVVEVPDALADEYALRRWYRRLPSAPEVPSGTVTEVLEWAGSDSNRRAAALAAEKAGKNRKGIIEALS